jgi:hypothetical protein
MPPLLPTYLLPPLLLLLLLQLMLKENDKAVDAPLTILNQIRLISRRLATFPFFYSLIHSLMQHSCDQNYKLVAENTTRGRIASERASGLAGQTSDDERWISTKHIDVVCMLPVTCLR